MGRKSRPGLLSTQVASYCRPVIRFALVLVFVTALVSTGCGHGESVAQEHARAVADAEMEIGNGAYVGGPKCCHVSGAERIAPRLWRVEVKWNGEQHWSCARVDLDHFYIHDNGGTISDGGYGAIPGRCPPGSGAG
jgi:hypothetical protein